MLRYGRISELNSISGKGKIVDSNQQDISFEVPKINSLLALNDQVRFRISEVDGHLQATDVKKNLSRLPEEYL